MGNQSHAKKLNNFQLMHCKDMENEGDDEL